MTSLSVSGFIWTCELISTAHLAYKSSIVLHNIYKSSKSNFQNFVHSVKCRGGNRHEPDWVIIDPKKPEGWEDSEEAFPINVKTSDNKEEKKIVEVIVVS